MKSLRSILIFLTFSATTALAQVPPPVTSLGGTDDIQRLIKGYPPEKYDITSTLCGLKPTPEFTEGYTLALRIVRLGAKPHYLIYDESDKVPESYQPLPKLTLTHYKHTAKLLESIRGFNFSMSMQAFEAKFKDRARSGSSPASHDGPH